MWSLITTYFEGKLTPYIKLGVAVIISIFPFLNSSSIISFCSLKSPAWWNTTPFSAASASLRQVVVGSDPFFFGTSSNLSATCLNFCFCSFVVFLSIFLATYVAKLSVNLLVDTKLNACELSSIAFSTIFTITSFLFFVLNISASKTSLFKGTGL